MNNAIAQIDLAISRNEATLAHAICWGAAPSLIAHYHQMIADKKKDRETVLRRAATTPPGEEAA